MDIDMDMDMGMGMDIWIWICICICIWIWIWIWIWTWIWTWIWMSYCNDRPASTRPSEPNLSVGRDIFNGKFWFQWMASFEYFVPNRRKYYWIWLFEETFILQLFRKILESTAKLNQFFQLAFNRCWTIKMLSVPSIMKLNFMFFCRKRGSP